MIFINVLMVVLIVTVQLSYQRPSLSNQRRLQGRYRRNSDDITAAPLSEEEFQLSLYQSVETNEKDPINQGISTAGLIEGDIAGIEVDSGDGNKSYNYVNSAEVLWPGGIVPYIISDIFNREERKIIARGIRNIQDKSCIQFVPRTTEPDYVAIMNGNGCYSQIGRKKGKQDLSLQRNLCMNVETVIHELMHALGFEHEHNRPDRDKFININEDNLKEGAFKNHFEKYDPLRYTNLTEYDLNSIMHYKAFAWAKNESIPSIRSKIPKKKVIGSVDGFLSQLDQLKLKTAYKCELSLAINVECPVSNLGPDNLCIKIPKYGCYCIVKEKKSREDADQFCRDNQMQLVWLETQKEEDEVANLMVENDMSGFWTSGADRELNGKWRWEQMVSSASFPVKYTNWCRGEEPDNYDGNEYYVVVRNHPDGKRCWEDAPGHIRWPSICKPPLSTKMLLDNLVKLHSQLTVAFNEIQELQKRNIDVVSELKELKEHAPADPTAPKRG